MPDTQAHIASTTTLGALLLAAGKGTRMQSDNPKVLQKLLEEPMLRYVYDATLAVCPETTWTIVGHQAQRVLEAFPEQASRFILQEPQCGTGHALQVAMPFLESSPMTHVLIINGDTPLIQKETLSDFAAHALDSQADLAFISLTLPDPAAFGRVVRKNGQVTAIVEAKDFDPSVHGEATGEINAGIYLLRLKAIAPLLNELTDNNKSKELYLTDLIGLAVAQKLSVLGVNRGNDPALMGINTPQELVQSEEILRTAIVEKHARNGVFIRSPQSVRIGPDVCIEPGADITGPAELYGNCSIGQGTVISSHCRLQDANLGNGVHVHSFSHIQEASIGNACSVGPYARLRPGSIMEEKAHIGNFVEMKKSRLGKGAKASHLTYLGDTEVGPRANIGAGTITCNYDGVNKHQTVIGEEAFIGSNSSLIAPVRIGARATVGAGSAITKDIPEEHLGVTRGQQSNRHYPRKR